MIDLERQKNNFKDHAAIFTDYGNIKILDFKKPNSNHYRIRFLFEEDYCRLHISGDLGELIAVNYNNMTYDRFSDFVNDVDYFRSKIVCHSRALDYYDEDKAREEIVEYLKEHELYKYVIENYYFYNGSDDEKATYFLDDVMEDFDDESGIGSKGYEILCGIYSSIWEYIYDFGKEETGILDLYMLAFKLAQKQLKEESERK